MCDETVMALPSDLWRLGVAEGDAVMVHASLRKLGAVQGGAEGVIAALDRAVGNTGTLLMVLGARDDWSWVNERPEAERASLLADAYGPGSALERLIQARGKVLRLGADIDTVTLLHYAEHLAEVPKKRRVVRYRKVLVAGRSEIRPVETLDDSNGIVDYPGPDYFGVILREYLATGRARQGVVGLAPSELIDGADLVRFGSDWMTQHLSALAQAK